MRERFVHVHKLPRHVPATNLAGSVVIVIDLLRASTTICQALASGRRKSSRFWKSTTPWRRQVTIATKLCWVASVAA